jgi:transaldolase
MDLTTACTDLATLIAEAAALAAPYDAQIQALEIARADATAALTFQIETLKAVIRPLILAQHQSVKVPGCSAIYVHKLTWDSKTLLAMAQELPALLQCQRDASYVSFR